MGIHLSARWVGLGLTLAAIVVAPPVAAQPEAESEPPPPPAEARWFSLDRLDAFLEVEARYDQSRVQTDVNRPRSTTRTQTNRDFNIIERVGFDIGGTVLDPQVFTFDGELSFGLTQSRYEEEGWSSDDGDTDTGYLLEYDLRANFFTGRRLSGTVHALRQKDRIDRRFLPSLDETRTGFGTAWYFADDHFPMELSYDYLDTDRTGNRNRVDDEHFLESTLHYGADWIINPHHKVKFSFEHAETKQEYQGSRYGYETTRDLFTVDHELEFGDDYQHRFRTLINWQEESGDLARNYFNIGPQLTLQHTPDLQTAYKYQFTREKYEAFDVGTHRADWQLVHQAYTNLTTTVDLFGLYEDFDDDEQTRQAGAMVDWQYNRRNPWGHLYADLSVGYDTEDSSGDDGARVVLNEAGTFRDPLDITLRNRDVRPLSVVVTDTGNRRIFVRGVDYVQYDLQGYTRLRRIPTGRIADGDSVLVDYQYSTPTDGKIDTLRTDFALEQRFNNGLTPYYRLSYRNQEVDRTTGFGRYADRTDHHRLGLKYEKDRLLLSGEYEIFDDTVEPYDAFHAQGLYHVLKSGDHTLDLSAHWSRYFFEGGYDRRNASVLDLEADHRWRIRADLSTFERVAFRWQDDSVAGVTRGWDVAAGLDYVMGELTAELSLEYDRLELPDSQEDDFGVYVRVRRDIPNVLGR